MKRFLALFLVCCMVLGLMPAVAFAQEAPADPLTDADYVLADLMWEAVNQKEQEMHSKRSPVTKTVDALVNTVTSSPYYAEGSLIRNGDFIVWETIDGIPCGYSPSLFNRTRDAKPMEGYDPATAETELTVSFHTKGGTPGNRDVFIIQPYYGIDSSFTDQYNNEGEAIAQALGGSCTTYRTTAASIDKIADAIESGAVVVFDSHGDTDYYGSNEDYTSKANTSYICLQTNSGLTSADYELANGEFGDYYHAYYAGLNGSMRYYCVDGTAISNHMEKNSANGLLWMAICLGMATDGLQAPLRAKGVEVAYGYSQSVTFDYDYEWETVFWDEMMMGATVSEAIAKMKDEVGLWDWCHATDYDTIAEAREMDCAFPIVVSSEDKYPGHGNVDDLQAVYSTWTLMSDCSHSSVSYIPAMAASCTTDGNIAYYLCDSCNAIFTDEACTNRINISSTVISALGHNYDNGVVTTQATCGTAGILTYTCSRCKSSYTESIDPLGHNYVDGACANCGQAKPDVVPFTIGASGTYIIAANVNGTYYAMSNVFPTSSNKIKGTIISITDGFVDEAFATDYAVTLNYDSTANTYTIESNGSYLKYPSSTNLTASSTPYSWTITQGENGSWRILSQTSNRALIFRANGYSLFGGYYLPNANAGNSEYFDMEIIPVGTSGTDSPVPGCPHENTTQAMVPASCETEGRLTLTCDDCGAVINDQILPASGHSWVEGELITAPTCVKEGVRAYSCSSCGASKTEVVSALGHQWNDGELTTAPSCTVAGLRTFTCSVCSETKTESLPSTGHSWNEGVVTTEPSCTEDGVKTYTCSSCGETTKEAILAIGHDFIDDICSQCGLENPVTVSPFEPGSSGAFVLAANVNGVYYAMKANYPSSGKVESGIITLTDGYIEEQYAYDYQITLNYDSSTDSYTIFNGTKYLKYNSSTNIGSDTTPYSWTIEAGTNGTWRIQSGTAERALLFRASSYNQFGGYSTKNISSGGKEYFDIEIIPVRSAAEESPVITDDSIVINHTLNLASDISINYAVKTSMLDHYDSFYMECILPVYDGNEELRTETIIIDPVPKGSYYYFTLTGLTAVQMGDMIDATLRMTKGEQNYASLTDRYSVSTYAYAQLAKDDVSDSLKKLCAELLRYGAEAQTYKGYRIDALVSSSMTDDHRSYLTDPEAVTFGNHNQILDDIPNPTVKWVGKALNLESKVILKFVMDLENFTGDTDQLSLHVSYKNYKGETVNLVIEEYQLYNPDKNYYAFDLDCLLAAELRCVVSAAVYEGDTQVSPTVQYSADSYGNGKTGGLLTLCKALMAYSDTALAYFTTN